ncbi:MAG: hypothetical protein PHS14_19025 [Elusimicrobia bacterium]|nr:hypothetical protein [Elusimicrobiota bacterium]
MPPPTNIEPHELFQKLRERPAPSDVYAFPRRGEDGEPLFSVRIFVLSDARLQVCRDRARKWLVERTKDTSDAVQAFDAHQMGDRLAKELLAESVFEDLMIGESSSGPVYKRIFRDATDVCELTSDEIAALYGAYLYTQVSFGPTEATFADPAETMAWVNKLTEGARPFALTLLVSHQRDELLLSLARLVSSLSKILASPPESWAQSLESLRETWRLGIDSSTSPAAGSSPSPDDESEPKLITREAAMLAAETIRRQSRL